MAKSEWADLFTSDLLVAVLEIAELIAAQERQNRSIVNLVASETYCPAATLAAEASELINKNAGGYPPRVSFNGGELIADRAISDDIARSLPPIVSTGGPSYVSRSPSDSYAAKFQ